MEVAANIVCCPDATTASQDIARAYLLKQFGFEEEAKVVLAKSMETY